METNLGYDYVSDIPWEDDPAFAFSNDSAAYFRAFKAAVDMIPIGDGKVSFLSNIWDFSSYFTNTTDSKAVKMNFTDFPDEIRMHAKFFVLHCIMGKTKMSSAFLRANTVKYLVRNILDSTDNTSFFTITTEDIITYIQNKGLAPSTAHNQYESVYQFYYFLINNYRINLPVDIQEIKDLGIREKNLSKSTLDDDKIPNIPEPYFQKILSTAQQVMRNTKLPYNDRATACMIVILSQEGFRVGDLLCLKVNQLFEKKLPKIEKSVHYIHYQSVKPTKPHHPIEEFDIYCSSIAVEAFSLLKRLRKKCIYNKDIDFLYILEPTPNSKNKFPVPSHRFRKEYARFIYQYLHDDAQRHWEGITATKYPEYNKQQKKVVLVDQYYPDPRQFRVHVCTDFYNHGVTLTFIQKYMGHLSEYMLGYYVRPKDSFQEDLAYSEKFIKEVAGDGVTPLGGDGKGTEIQKSICDFISKNHFNIHKDIDAIIKALGDRVIVRGKMGGVCIKTSLMPCARDTRTNNFMCAYNYCPNLFHMYYMADISLSNFRHLQETYSALEKNGNTMAAQKEFYKLRDILHRRLLPELDALDNEIKNKGAAYVIEKYPNMLEIIHNEDNIRREAAKWMNKLPA